MCEKGEQKTKTVLAILLIATILLMQSGIALTYNTFNGNFQYFQSPQIDLNLKGKHPFK